MSRPPRVPSKPTQPASTQPTLHRACRRLAPALLAAFAASCVPGGGSTTANTGGDKPAELVFCRVHATSSQRDEMVLRTAQNLGKARVPDRTGRELQVRVHPDGERLVFVRRRTPSDPDSAEIHVAGTTSAIAEQRLTANNTADDHPCWSPSGDRILFVTERDGERRLYRTDPAGVSQQPFQTPGPGVEDDEPDWSRAVDRIVFTRRQSAQRQLFLINGDGTGLVPFGTARPSPSADIGPREPTFSPDGSTVAYVWLTATGVSRLFAIDVGTGTEQEILDPQGEVRMPRWSLDGERIFCGLAQPTVGRQGLRLAVVPATGGEPALIEPGEQWMLGGVDVLPALAVPPAAAPAETVPLSRLELQLSSGTPVLGGKSQLADEDGESLVLATEPFNGRDIASINCKWELPVADANDVLLLRARIVARVTRTDADTVLRTSLFNPVEERFDTIAELPDPGTTARTLTFTTQSLAHVSLERHVRFSVIGDISPGAAAELHIDQVRLEFVKVLPPVLRQRR